jgi:flagellar motor switch/type III secretory pathway protein FliN
MDWRPFKLLNVSERTWLARGVRAALGEWLAAWLPATPAGAVRCIDPTHRAATRLAAEPPRWLAFTHRDATLSIALSHDVERTLAEWLLGADRRSALAEDVCIAALTDLAGRLLHAGAAAPAVAQQPPADHCWQRGSGAAIVEADLGAHALALVGSPAWVAQQNATRPQAKPAGRAAPVDPRQCIGRARLSLQAWAGSAAVEIGVLQSLAPGDVIRLDARIDQPLPVTVQGRETGRGAYLGSVDGRRALHLAKRTHPLSASGAAP